MNKSSLFSILFVISNSSFAADNNIPPTTVAPQPAQQIQNAPALNNQAVNPQAINPQISPSSVQPNESATTQEPKKPLYQITEEEKAKVNQAIQNLKSCTPGAISFTSKMDNIEVIATFTISGWVAEKCSVRIEMKPQQTNSTSGSAATSVMPSIGFNCQFKRESLAVVVDGINQNLNPSPTNSKPSGLNDEIKKSCEIINNAK